MLYKVKYLIADVPGRYLLANLADGIGDIEVAHIEDAVNLCDGLYLFGRESMSMHPYGVESHIRNRLAAP